MVGTVKNVMETQVMVRAVVRGAHELNVTSTVVRLHLQFYRCMYVIFSFVRQTHAHLSLCMLALLHTYKYMCIIAMVTDNLSIFA